MHDCIHGKTNLISVPHPEVATFGRLQGPRASRISCSGQSLMMPGKPARTTQLLMTTIARLDPRKPWQLS